MAWGTLAEGGANPIMISEGGGRDREGNIGIWIILLFIFIIAVVAIPLFSRREPVTERGTSLAEILPAMMVAQTASQRQTVDVNSHNTGIGSCGTGPSNFQLYQQGVATNDNVFVQSCQTRELIREDGNETRDLINERYVHSLELQIARQEAQLIAKDNQLTSERQYNAITLQNTTNYNSLQQQIYSLSNQVQKEPIPAYCVSPYASYRPGFTFTEPVGERCGGRSCG